MHTVKVILLLACTVLVMRLVSWIILWIFCRALKKRSVWAGISANVTAFGFFVLLLFLDRLPGEPLDDRAVWFGFSVFAFLALVDSRWRPKWFVRRRSS